MELATDVSAVLISYQFELSSLPCSLNCGAVVVIAHILTTSCTLLDAPANKTAEVAFREFTFIALSNSLFCGSALWNGRTLLVIARVNDGVVPVIV